MTEPVKIEPIPDEDRIPVLRQQASRFQSYALGLARKAGMNAQEASVKFLEAKPAEARTRRQAGPEEIGQIAAEAAAFFQLMSGCAAMEREGDTWTIAVPVSEDLRQELRGWDVPTEFFVAWFAEVQRLEGEDAGIDWETRLDGNTLYQRLHPRD